MPYLVTYEVGGKALATCVSDDRAALRLATSLDAQGLTGVTIQDGGTEEVFRPWPSAFDAVRTQGRPGPSPRRGLAMSGQPATLP